MKTEPPVLTKYSPEVPAELERIVTKALCKDQDERYQAVKGLELDLKALKQRKSHVSPGELAILYTAMGERERAFASLEQAYEEHDLQLQYLGISAWFDPLRSDARFGDLLRRMGLAP